MELLRYRMSEFQMLILEKIERFDLVDVGCSGGIDNVWREMDDKLFAYGFDSNRVEIERLRRQERSTNISYVAAKIIAGEHAVPPRRNPWSRLAVHDALNISAAQRLTASSTQKTYANDWDLLPQASKEVNLPDFFEDVGLKNIDFFKIDIDGPDFGVLLSLRQTLDDARVLGVGMEVNWIGSSRQDEHTFHNTDRFLRSCGFDLYDFTKRTYSSASMPERFCLSFPAQSVSGRPLQGDAVYLRDLASPEFQEEARKLPPSKILKLAFLQSMIRQPDSAAETLLVFRDEIGELLDVGAALDLLVRESSLSSIFSSYEELMAAFRENSSIFYP